MPHLPSVPPSHLSTTYRTWARLQELKANPSLALDGNSLDIASVVAVAYHDCIPELSSDPEVLGSITDSVRVLMDHLDNGFCVYGVNTGFGGSADSRTDRATALQAALLQLTQAGILVASDKDYPSGSSAATNSSPEPHSMPSPWVRASIAVRANSNARGHSAVTMPILTGLLNLLKHGITPIIPVRGSVSASGDLMPLSYIAGAITGSPDIYVRVQDAARPCEPTITTARDALTAAGLPLLTLGPKEGLGLVNGTAVSAGVATLAMHESNMLAVTTQALAAMGVEALQGTAESFHPFIHATRPHPGQVECAANILTLLQGSHLAIGVNREKDRKLTGLIQDRYAWRSVPQWVGPQLEDLQLATRQITTELNSSCDNPLIDTANRDIFCGANFQAAAVTSAMEKTRLSLQMLGKIIFAQATELVDPNYNNGLPTNLVSDDASLSFTMKGVDISMAAYMAELAYLAHPVSAHVQTAEMRNQAVNSLALISARFTMQAVELVGLMSAAYLYVCCQAVDLRALHLRVVEGVRGVVGEVTRGTLAGADAALVAKVVDAVAAAWPTTTRLGIPARCRTAVQAAVPVFVDGGASVSLDAVREWQAKAAEVVEQVYHAKRAEFLEKPHTEELLGAGSRVLYTTVRRDLKVPFHQGFVEHPTPESEELDGRPKRTVGSWISIIYEALRKGELQAPLFAKLNEVVAV
ncbi:phenylalanine ammonia-lyase [Aspergillus heteromorphus CBS 117.55]|uniref:Phenylalanine ammonia-lyase n=1 Tax=Aspergillus heteromorphus CBS 117.55 TaxID=1448321 RepID=A0A317V8E5_9EURO|nr:phenylalanine ammonia-lyase [Aspergillus heteromorphus CBS 117.55]PWY69112.1 phenylalanine ammonia-lyase [Aspergillus heteromorphus CBS 117.55]